MGVGADLGYLSITGILKATPAEEGGDRFVYVEASNERLDQQGEKVLAKALETSRQDFLKYGNLDIDHVTQIGLRAGIDSYDMYEIGVPVDVRHSGGATFVKGQIYRGDTRVAEKANAFWDSLTRLNPPARWFPSIGGKVLDRDSDKGLIKAVRWTNIGFSKTPVNQYVPEVSTIPFGVLAKCWGVAGLDMGKALEAGYGTAPADMTGGGPLRKQSLDKGVKSYWDFREAISAALKPLVSGASANQIPARLVRYAVTKLGLEQAEAAEYVEKFLNDLKAKRAKA